MTAPAAASSGALMVQLGSFASRANAERLARRLRAQGFTVGVSQGSSGRHLYRVRAGPVNDRAAATELAEHLRSAGHAGSIVPQ
jgi:cell division protein FtsN